MLGAGGTQEKGEKISDISESWVEKYGNCEAGEEKSSGFFEEKERGVLTCLGGRWREF